MSDLLSLDKFIDYQISGDWGKGEKQGKFSKKVFCIRGTDLNDINFGNFSNLPIRYIDEKNSKKILQKENIIIEVSGGSPVQSTGRVSYYNRNDFETICSNFCRAYKIKSEYSSKYFYYLIKNIYNSNVFFNFESKTNGIKNLLVDIAFKNIKVQKNNLQTQQKIASVLSALDDKIELNNRINAELEAMAKTLYDYWFVQFDFPFVTSSGVEKPYKSSGGKMVYNETLKREIPEAWEVKTIGDYCKSTGGFAFKSSWWTDKGMPVVKIKDIKEDYTIDLSNLAYVDISDKIIDDKFIAKAGDILIAMTGATVGKYAIVPITENPLYVNQRVGYFNLGANPEKRLPFLINSLNQKYFREMIFTLASGAAQPNISNEQINNIQLLLPNKKIIDLYNQTLESTYKKILKNQQQNQELSTLRDWLLPMLMNGQVTVG